MSNVFEHIRPYTDEEIGPAMSRIADNKYFPVLASYVFPDMSFEQVRELLFSLNSIHDFQTRVMYPAHQRIIANTISAFTYSGLENIDKETAYLYMSNHRDIMLDASLLQIILVENGFDTSEITFGANLMQNDLVIDIGKSNKMFRVERPGGSIREFYMSSLLLSEYIRYTLKEKKQSIWIAQRNGRTKDGVDRTEQGIINMFRMSGDKENLKSIVELNIAPVAVSYEWEPCDILKTLELYLSAQGPYEKKEGEDLNSILTGILQPKGRVHIHICTPFTEDELFDYSNLQANEFNRQVAAMSDRKIYKGYRLWPNNYIAHDILYGTDEYKDHYSAHQKAAFVDHMKKLDTYAEVYDLNELKRIFLGIYGNPVEQLKILE